MKIKREREKERERKRKKETLRNKKRYYDYYEMLLDNEKQY